MTERLGVWMVGALGGIGTTLVVGARAISRGLVSDTGLVTNRPEFASLGLVGLPDLVFGGHEVRRSDYWESAYQINRYTGSLDLEVIQQLKDDLLAISGELRSGSGVNCGAAIEGLINDDGARGDAASLPDLLARIRGDLSSFRERHGLDRVVVVNLASTEPGLESVEHLDDPARLRELIAKDSRSEVRASMLYTLAALEEGCGYLNFTPSTAALCPALRRLAEERGLPYMGNDGKTGETLVKSALAPMFKYRNLRVLSWQGYNMLGDRDGQVLSHRDNLASKVRSKDAVLQSILGYPLHTHVGIDFVESLDDLKTAWDFIHFRGFLDHKMSMQFVWQGCDSILAAPLVLDMLRFTDLAMRRGESGAMQHLACYFKSPLSVDEHDLHKQFGMLNSYVRHAGAKSD